MATSSRSYKERVLDELERQGGDRDVDNYKYAGGNRDPHLEYYYLQLNSDLCALPEEKRECICGHSITENCYIKHKQTGIYVVLGNCCIKKFIPTAGRSCDKCGASHRNRKYNMCNGCISQMPYGKKNFNLIRKYESKIGRKRQPLTIQTPASPLLNLAPKRTYSKVNTDPPIKTNPDRLIDLRIAIQEAKLRLLENNWPMNENYYRPPDTKEEEERALEHRAFFLKSWRHSQLKIVSV